LWLVESRLTGPYNFAAADPFALINEAANRTFDRLNKEFNG
jgi:hypothetical protein